MRPLREQIDSPDEQTASAARLVSHVAPLDASDLRAARTRHAIERRLTGGFRPQKRAALLVAFVLGAAVSAGATYGALKWDDTVEGPGSLSDTEPMSGALVQGGLSKNHEGEAPEPRGHESTSAHVEPIARAEDSPNGALVLQARTSQVSGAGSTAPSSSRKQGELTKQPAAGASDVHAATPEAQAVASEAQLVQKAVKALRNSGDADRAEQLLREYRKKSSSGQLDEEALALSIEVALAKRDPSAASYARSYLAKYPNGRFQDLARRALAR